MNLRWKIAQMAELIWWNFYLKNKPTEEYLLWKTEYWHSLLKTIGLNNIDFSSNKILDAGCGPAGIFTVFRKAIVDAIDPLIDEYEQKVPHFKKQSYPYVTFYASPIETFEFVATYDFVFCINAVNHVENIFLCLDRLIAAISPGGTLILSVDTHNYFILKKFFQLVPGDILHPHQYNLVEYHAMLKNRGCTILQTHLLRKQCIFDYHIIMATKV